MLEKNDFNRRDKGGNSNRTPICTRSNGVIDNSPGVKTGISVLSTKTAIQSAASTAEIAMWSHLAMAGRGAGKSGLTMRLCGGWRDGRLVL